MGSTVRSHNRSHKLLLLQKLLNLRDSASPLTLLIDTLEQTAAPAVREFTTRAKLEIAITCCDLLLHMDPWAWLAGRVKFVFVSFATVKQPQDTDVFVRARGKSLAALRSEILAHCPGPVAPGSAAPSQRALIVLDSLNPLAAAHPKSLATFLSSIISPVTSMIAVYHNDVPLVFAKSFSEYEPHPLTVLCHLATAILRVSSLYQAIERRKAQNRSQQEPEWGLREGREGVFIGLRTEEYGVHAHGIVLNMELRRRSGRSIVETFVLPDGSSASSGITLLSDHPLFSTSSDLGEANSHTDRGEGDMETTFSLGLTEKQRRDREGVVLPYFDAQTEIGAGDGGRILYEMGREDDFDDEEDEI